MRAADFIVIGGGIAGAAVAWRLAEHGSVVLLEAEERPGYHATGRSAAMFDRAYGNAVIRELTAASHDFFRESALPGLEQPLLTARGVLYVATAEQREVLQQFFAAIAPLAPTAVSTNGATAEELVPILRPGRFTACVWDPAAADIDVAALHAAWLRGLRARGGQVDCRRTVLRLTYHANGWLVDCGDHRYAAPVVVNAAGAWADEVAARAGLAPLGLRPLRRSIAVVPLPEKAGATRWPMTVDVGEQWYFKGEAGRVLVSPADETPVPAGDASPDDLDLATGVERFEAATTVEVQRVSASWAGLRSFFPDRTPVIGSDPRAPGFIWYAGLGGYGIQTAPAAAALAAAAATGVRPPAPLLARNVTPDRFL